MSAPPIKPIRRVVTGNDANGESCVLYDSDAPNVNPGAIRPGACMTDVWVYPSCPNEQPRRKRRGIKTKKLQKRTPQGAGN